MGTVQVKLKIADLASVPLSAEFIMAYEDMVEFRDVLEATKMGGVVKQVRRGIDAVLDLAESGWSSGEVESISPDYPENVDVDVLGRAVEISWGAVMGVDSYILRTSQGDITVNTTPRPTEETSMEFVGLAYGKTYRFRLSSVLDGIEGAMGPVNEAYIPYPTPTAPALTSSRGVNGEIELDWGTVEFAALYDVYRDGVLYLGDTDGTHLTIETPAVGTYDFYVIAKNPDAASDPSNVESVEVA